MVCFHFCKIYRCRFLRHCFSSKCDTFSIPQRVNNIKLFKIIYTSNDNTPFGLEDYKTIARAETIRSKSDYDDFYVANKDETKLLISNSGIFIAKVEEYLKEKE